MDHGRRRIEGERTAPAFHRLLDASLLAQSETEAVPRRDQPRIARQRAAEALLRLRRSRLRQPCLADSRMGLGEIGLAAQRLAIAGDRRPGVARGAVAFAEIEVEDRIVGSAFDRFAEQSDGIARAAAVMNDQTHEMKRLGILRLALENLRAQALGLDEVAGLQRPRHRFEGREHRRPRRFGRAARVRDANRRRGSTGAAGSARRAGTSAARIGVPRSPAGPRE